jgi:amino acid permease
MMKTQIGLGVLSIPLVFDTLGLIPGIICLIMIATMTGWSAYVIGIFKLNHPEVWRRRNGHTFGKYSKANGR